MNKHMALVMGAISISITVAFAFSISYLVGVGTSMFYISLFYLLSMVKERGGER